VSKYVFSAILLLVAQSAIAADVFRGKQVYMQHCVDCHGPSGEGVMAGAPNFTRGDALLKGDVAMMGVLRMGQGVMPGYSGLLDESEMEDVIAYLRTFL